MRTLRRMLMLSSLLLASVHASAGTLAECRQQAKSSDEVRSCVETERSRSGNQLRQAGLAAQSAVEQKSRETRRKKLLREFRAAQARHVRERRAACNRRLAETDRLACEADMNRAHIKQLDRFIRD